MITIRRLHSHEYHLYATFINARNIDSRRIYFGYIPSPEYITNFVSKMATPSDNVVVAENEKLEIVGTVHIAAMSDEKVELGVMVHEDYRQQGISSKMMSFAMLWCKNRGYRDIYMHCLAYNAPVIHLVKKFGLEIHKDGYGVDSYTTLPRPTAIDQLKESAHKRINRYQRTKNQAVNSLVGFSRLMTM